MCTVEQVQMRNQSVALDGEVPLCVNDSTRVNQLDQTTHVVIADDGKRRGLVQLDGQNQGTLEDKGSRKIAGHTEDLVVLVVGILHWRGLRCLSLLLKRGGRSRRRRGIGVVAATTAVAGNKHVSSELKVAVTADIESQSSDFVLESVFEFLVFARER